MDTLQAGTAWAEEEFGAARLNDRRNVVRLVSLATSVAHHPHVLVAAAFPDMTERDAAYDFLENDRIDPRKHRGIRSTLRNRRRSTSGLSP